FKYAGVIMDESPMHCWTNHQSFVEFNGQWYLFYHQNALSPKFDKNRSVCIDSLFFNADGTIQKVLPTLRGVGLTKASQKIEIDRYSNKSPTGSSIAFIDSSDAFKGWKALLNSPNAWMQYNAVDFKKPMLKRVQAKVRSSKGGILQLRLDKPDGPVLSEITLPGEHEWKTITAAVRNCPHGIHNLVVVLKKGHPIEIDWVTFY
ncbi:MAG: carbohydrate-binding protein, partial [Bacteroidota bacterium]|nr:carbohydrate-binding protein [Bacteroidota bacterium]